jgi:general secretion pathway protein G
VKNKKGFTLIEVIVVAGIIAILAGILVPMIMNQIDEAKQARAFSDCKSISTAISTFRKDTGKWPYYMPGDCTQTYLTLQSGTGTDPINTIGDWQISANDIALGIILNLPGATPPIAQSCYNNKAGTYIPEDKADPWDHKYIVSAANFAVAASPVWVISAGPNGCFDTTVNSQTLNDAPCVAGQAGDDIGIRIK